MKSIKKVLETLVDFTEDLLIADDDQIDLTEVQEIESAYDVIHHTVDTDKVVNFNFFLYIATRAHFRYIWGESLGDHFWTRYRGKNGIRLFLWNITDHNLEILSKHLDKIDYREGLTVKQIQNEFGDDIREWV